MKHFLFFLMIITSSLGCNENIKKEKRVTEEKNTKKEDLSQKVESIKLDTTVVFWQTSNDTSREVKNINLDSNNYNLELLSYSLNDSSVIRFNDLNKPKIYKDIYHNNVSQINLRTNDISIFNFQIRKDLFIDSLDGDFLDHSVLSWIDYKSIDANRIFFNGVLNVPDTDWSVGFDFNVYYKSKLKGEISYSNFQGLD